MDPPEDVDQIMGEVEQAIGLLENMVPAAIWPWLIVSLGALLALLVHALLWRPIRRFCAGREGLVFVVLPRLRRPSRLFLLMLVSLLLVNVAGLPPGWRSGLSQLAAATLMIVVGWVLIAALDVACERVLGRLPGDIEENFAARKQATQARMIQRIGRLLIVLLTAGLVLSSFDSVRQFGVSLFASAGAAGLVLGFAARPVLANLIAGIQIALTQPIRIDDVVIVEGEWGWIEEIASTYVVVRVWDWRRLVVPLSYFIEQPFQNWTRESGSIIGAVTWHLDFTAPVSEIRAKLEQIVAASPRWDRNVVNLQVTDSDRQTITIRALMSARTSPIAWDLRCEVREAMLDWLRTEHPGSLPRSRGQLHMAPDAEIDAGFGQPVLRRAGGG
ncbi:mechanosensitive ion channel family protein [Roseisalinus antarcticus]|uniref:Miniconductance mechanosensitive channel MscM n=1 Tax=Roseisalinus antarcticus TaxID=254357 RepID=A0A1Y5S397_9RHOB|nr:mechanosensitive ion channel family protein [Roseisalinus antarcticus]SLN28759.1 Miniconductance mechanosensitive channel MscM precursor [Roseisalinus antarcticus]